MAAKKSAASVALGVAIRSARQDRRYGQASFAAHAGIDRSHYDAIERGAFNVRYSTILKIAIGLKVPVHELVRRTER